MLDGATCAAEFEGPEMSKSTRPGSHSQFPTTRWSLVARAGGSSSPEARAALESLCHAYWFPIYAFIRRQSADPETARDLAQSYFTRLIEKDLLASADPKKGRFRSFLRTDCGYFLADQRDRDRAQKRGGGRPIVSIETLDSESRYLREPADRLNPEHLFDRAWCLTLLERVLERIKAEYVRSGRIILFERLQFVLISGSPSVPYATIADELDTTVGAVQAAVQRLRRRYRTVLRAEIAATLNDPSDENVDDEIRDLFAALEA
jgi:DNA-directed RNA polymerase specialized sigma24 family protein